MELRIERVGKTYRGAVRALDDVSLTLGPGIVGLLGPNGAGKSTLMRILATVTRPSEGRVTWDGRDLVREPNAVRAVLGYLPQDFGVYPHLTAVEFLDYLAAVKRVPAAVGRTRIPELLALVNLGDAAKRPLGSYSGGMRQRIGIAQALLNDPELLIVDEPTVGLDPEERVRFRTLLSDLAGERIILLSTHIVSDLESAAERIALLDRGRLLAFDTPEGLLRAAEGQVWSWIVDSDRLAATKAAHRVSGAVRRGDAVHVRVIAPGRPVPEAVPAIPTLEDAYMARVAGH